MKGHVGPVADVAFSNDGGSLATATRDGTVRIWSVKDGRERSVLKGSRSIDNVALSPNGLYVVTSSYRERSVWLWSARTGRPIALLVGQHDAGTIMPALTRAAFNSDGTQVAIVSGGDSVQLSAVPVASGSHCLCSKICAPRTDPLRAQALFSAYRRWPTGLPELGRHWKQPCQQRNEPGLLNLR